MTFAVNSNVADNTALMQALDTFLVTTDGSWTQDDFDTGNREAAWHQTSPAQTYVSFSWDIVSPFGIAMHHALGFTPGNSPGTHPSDSGNGGRTTERRISGLGGGPYDNVFFMSDSTATNGTYVHVIVEFAVNQYRHFSFGFIDKRGTWTGGSYAVANHWDQQAVAIDVPLDVRHTFLWDGVHTFTTTEPGTLHADNLPGQPGTSVWGIIWGSDGSPGTDTGGNSRISILGGVRDGPSTPLTFFPATTINGFVPLVEIPLFYRNLTPSPDEWRLLGYAPGARLINIRHFDPEQEITIGSDTWKIFPWVRKRFQQDNQEETHNAGIAYQRIN